VNISISFALFGLAAPLVWQDISRADTWNVTDYGASGDAVRTLATTVSNSTQVCLAPAHPLTGADVGKLIELFGVGKPTSGLNFQDLIGTILTVTNGTNVTLSVPAGRTANNVNCTFGTQNAGAFQRCVDACQGTNAVVRIPAGCYLLVPPAILDSNFVMSGSSTLCPAIAIRKGGLQFQGDTPDDTILLGNGAWILNGGYVQRGILFGCIGPVTHDAPLIFENLTLDGGVAIGNIQLGSGPASPVDGSGWDITHDAVVDMGGAPYHADKQFIDCHFVHWRGEMVKSVVALSNGFIGVTNCTFCDGNGSGYNFNWTPFVINGCLFSNLNMAVEYYVGSMQTSSVFENNVVTNTRNGISLVGALTNYPSPGCTIVSNIISVAGPGILLGPARNVHIVGNTFFGGSKGIATDSAAYQGTDINSDILVENNRFVNTQYPLAVCGGGPDRLENMTWKFNTALGCLNFAGGYGWSSNIVFIGNQSLQPAPNHLGQLDGSQLAGECFIDDLSNNFPWWDVNFENPSQTNTASYSFGMRQRLNVTANAVHGICFLAAGSPPGIPEGAELAVTNASAYSLMVYAPGSRPSSNPLTLPAGACFTYAWSNAMWNLVPAPPNGLRITNP